MSPEPDVAPYRIVRRIGAGGMGEVFLAEDDRLARRVAIKRLHPDRQLDASGRERLRREARFAAGLSHPAIVQVHDVLERAGADFVVMEWVEGENLRQHLKREGPLPVALVVDLARQVAGGLAEAHRAGIVHRDLKAENVLVTADGRVKIADFGIAKRVPAAAAESWSDDEVTLTQDAAVLGTFRTMSPEQALGQSVDPRSDLFSLGVLLYEALTGSSPFRSATGAETLRRVIEEAPPSVDTLSPGTPPPLVALVDQLLEKERDLRPRGAGEVERTLAGLACGDATVTGGAAFDPRASYEDAPRSSTPWWRRTGLVVAIGVLTVAGVAVMLLARQWLSAPPPEPIDVAATASEIRPVGGRAEDGEGAGGDVRDGDLETFAAAVRSAIVRALVGLEGVSAKAASEIDRVSGDPREVARLVAADEVVTSAIVFGIERSTVTIERLRAVDGVVLWNEALEVPSDDLVLVTRTIASRLRAAYPDLPVRAGTPGIDVHPDDLRRFHALNHRYTQGDDPSGEALRAGLETIRGRSPHFFDADVLAAQVALHRFYDSRDPSDLEWARRAVERAEAQAPDDPRTLRQRFELERRAGRLEAADEVLDRLSRIQPGDVSILDLRGRLRQAQGRGDEALVEMREAVRRRPSLNRLVDLARVERDLGQIDAARAHLLEADRRSPKAFEAVSLLAELELGSGDPAAAAELYRRLLRRSPGTSERSNLGVAYMLLGDYARAVEQFDLAYTAEPRNPFFALNLADGLLLSGDAEGANARYQEVVQQIGQDPAATGPQFRTVEAQASAHLGRHREAVAALRQALSEAPNNPNVAYEASLVYALIGERTSALVHAQAAIDRGVDRRWFGFPWFDEIRGDLRGEPQP